LISLGKSGCADLIIEEIVHRFSGIYIPNDCEDGNATVYTSEAHVISVSVRFADSVRATKTLKTEHPLEHGITESFKKEKASFSFYARENLEKSVKCLIKNRFKGILNLNNVVDMKVSIPEPRTYLSIDDYTGVTREGDIRDLYSLYYIYNADFVNIKIFYDSDRSARLSKLKEDYVKFFEKYNSDVVYNSYMGIDSFF